MSKLLSKVEKRRACIFAYLGIAGREGGAGLFGIGLAGALGLGFVGGMAGPAADGPVLFRQQKEQLQIW